MKILILLISLIFTFSSLISQSYDGEIILNNRGKIKAENISIGNEEITFVYKGQDSIRTIDKSLVSKLRVNVGNNLYVGIGVGVIIGALIYNRIQMDLGSSNIVFLYICGGGALVGGLIGLVTTNYRTINIYKNYTTTLLPKINFIPQTNYLNLQLLELTINL